MATIVPPPPADKDVRLEPLPDHTQLPSEEREKVAYQRSTPIPDHTMLPDKDGAFVRNTYEPLQSHLLSETLRPVLRRLRPAGDYLIGEDCGIYWRLTEPPERGVKAPDWFCVPGVPGLLQGQLRRSYVMWQEAVPPLIILEYVSGDGSEERDRTPNEGKFWVYEQALHCAFYGIYAVNEASLEMFHHHEGVLERMPANASGRYPIAALGVELGVWRGRYGDFELPWLRWWDSQGNLLQTGEERAERLAERLRALGVDPNQREA
jgi:Uma2 family endonuclease